MFDLQRFTLPNFGLMTKADKQKLDSISTDTILTKTEASDTYATKTAVQSYIANVVESDTGYVFVNGNGTTIATIPIMQ